MPDPMIIGLVAYVQVGLLILGYLFYHGLGQLRVDVATLKANCESSLRGVQARLAALEQKVHQIEEAENRFPRTISFPVEGRAKRRTALEMAEHGAQALTIANTLEMQPAEVDLLMKLDRLRKGDSLPGATGVSDAKVQENGGAGQEPY